ncbi:MAG: SMI1/KNR4 family protein [bacterium]|nr:SMI1/KNR4 family protein [bacterium]MCM1424621.1 SMI1/KNR4 family protein [bacterium]
MDKNIFDNKVREIVEKSPRLFGLHSDNMASAAMIKDVEEYYNFKLPDSYKEYLKQYGGGYFGYIIVYSCDYNSMFYIKKNVAKELVLENAFLPIIDLETGDFIGFKILGEKCQNAVTLYLHEEDELQDLKMDFYDALLKYGLNCS